MLCEWIYTGKTTLKKLSLYYTRCITPKRVPSLLGSSPQHCVWATQLLRNKSHYGVEPLATLCSIWPAQDLNPYLPDQNPARYRKGCLAGGRITWKILEAVHKRLSPQSVVVFQCEHFTHKEREGFLHCKHPYFLVTKHENSVAFIALKFRFRCAQLLVLLLGLWATIPKRIENLFLKCLNTK